MSNAIENSQKYTLASFTLELLKGINQASKKEGPSNHSMVLASMMADNFKEIHSDYPGQIDPNLVTHNIEAIKPHNLPEVTEIIQQLGRYFAHKTANGTEHKGDFFGANDAFTIWNYFVEYKKITDKPKQFLSAVMGHIVHTAFIEANNEALNRDNGKLNLFAQHDLKADYISPQQRLLSLQSLGIGIEQYIENISMMFGAESGQKLFRKCLSSGQINPRTAYRIYRDIQNDLKPTTSFRRKWKR